MLAKSVSEEVGRGTEYLLCSGHWLGVLGGGSRASPSGGPELHPVGYQVFSRKLVFLESGHTEPPQFKRAGKVMVSPEPSPVGRLWLLTLFPGTSSHPPAGASSPKGACGVHL